MLTSKAQALYICLLLGFALILAEQQPASIDDAALTTLANLLDEYSLPDDIYNTTHNICANLRTIRDMIPYDTLRTLISEHYMHDTRFRRAMDFMDTASFRVNAARFSSSNAYQQLLVQFRRAGVQLIDIESISNFINCIIVMPPRSEIDRPPPVYAPSDFVNMPDYPNYPPVIPEYEYDDYGFSGGYYRSMHTFAMDFMALLPKERLRALYAANMAMNTHFGRFYKILRNQNLQRGFLRSLNSRQMVPINRAFRRHNIDMRRLFGVFFRVINTGPMPEHK